LSVADSRTGIYPDKTVERQRIRLISSLGGLLFLLLFAATGVYADTFARDDIILNPSPSTFSVCFDYGCESLANVSLNDEEWSQIRALFQPLPANAMQERQKIRQAIALFEKFAGKKTATEQDLGGTFVISENGSHQMDCIDESTNTSSYLRILQTQKLMRFHRVQDRETRGYFIFGWPHTTAVIAEAATGQMWVIDSWFHKNAQAPEIMPLEQWKQGWSPPDF